MVQIFANMRAHHAASPSLTMNEGQMKTYSEGCAQRAAAMFLVVFLVVFLNDISCTLLKASCLLAIY
jgi:hypothetical protein